MAGNTIGQLFRVTTFGESHGLALGAIVDGVPPNLSLTEADLQLDLDRRKPGTSQFATQRKTKLKFCRVCLKAKPQVHRLVY